MIFWQKKNWFLRKDKLKIRWFFFWKRSLICWEKNKNCFHFWKNKLTFWKKKTKFDRKEYEISNLQILTWPRLTKIPIANATSPQRVSTLRSLFCIENSFVLNFLSICVFLIFSLVLFSATKIWTRFIDKFRNAKLFHIFFLLSFFLLLTLIFHSIVDLKNKY